MILSSQPDSRCRKNYNLAQNRKTTPIYEDENIITYLYVGTGNILYTGNIYYIQVTNIQVTHYIQVTHIQVTYIQVTYYTQVTHIQVQVTYYTQVSTN